MTGNLAARSLLLTYGRNERSVGLELAVNLQRRVKFLGKSCSLDNLVNYLMACAALCGEAEHCHTWLLKTCNALRCLCSANGNLCKLACVRHWSNGNVAHYDDAILAILRLVGDEQHGSADTADARGTFNDLQGRTQGVASGAQRSADLSVGTFGLDNHTSEVERILHQLAGFLDGHSFLLAKLCEQFGILL